MRKRWSPDALWNEMVDQYFPEAIFRNACGEVIGSSACRIATRAAITHAKERDRRPPASSERARKLLHARPEIRRTFAAAEAAASRRWTASIHCSPARGVSVAAPSGLRPARSR